MNKISAKWVLLLTSVIQRELRFSSLSSSCVCPLCRGIFYSRWWQGDESVVLNGNPIMEWRKPDDPPLRNVKVQQPTKEDNIPHFSSSKRIFVDRPQEK